VARPLIGLPGRRKRIGQIEGFPSSLHELEVDVYFADYARSVLTAGGLPVHLPIDADAGEWIGVIDGIVLTGGADIEPGRYGRPNTHSDTEPRRDELELALLAGAIEVGTPVLGICRGLQVLNVHAGGTLHQHVPAHARYDLTPDARSQSVIIERGSVLHSIYGDAVTVNSLHHQTVDTVGAELRVTARADDGTVEGLELAGTDVIAVQWHPEMINHADPVFAWIVERAKARAAVG
jgi:putative glutamine amidotransferase